LNQPDDRTASFGQRLRELRARAGFLTGKEFASALGWQPSKVSRIENGNQLPTDSDITAWFQASGTPESVASGLHDELREIRIEAASWRRQLRTGHVDRQRRAEQTERKSSHIRAFEMGLLPGLVHTADYARHVLTTHAQLHGASSDVSQAVAVRMQRQHVLYDGSKTIDLLITESALAYAPCPPAVMVEQIDRLFTVAGLPAVRFGIIPLYTRLPVIPMHGFWIFDTSVTVETIDSEITVEAAADLDLYGREIDLLWSVAAEGEQARAILLSCAQRWADLQEDDIHG
jgi:transcriptional regulator with XRE-family HTH domain